MDIAPFAQQERANLWASFMIHLGNIVGYSTGYMNLKGIVGVEKDDNDIRFKILVLLAGITLVATTTVTCLLHKEKVYTPMSSPLGFFSTICNPFLDVFRSVLRLPKNIFFLCIVQFFCWVGWFPLLFYSTTYIGQVYSSQINFSLGKEKEEAERMGNLGSLFMAAVAFAVSTLVYYIQGTRYSLSLPHLWQLGCLLFTILTWVTMVISDVRAALAFNALIGICWAIGTWVPMAILGRILTGGKNVPPQSTKKTKAIDPSPSSTPYLDTEQSACSTASTVPMSVGIVLGIHNVFIVLPQFLSAGISHGIMSKTASEGDFVPGTLRDPTGWVMRVGGICSFIAFLLIFWLI
ncbi:hypothetical protein HMI54_011955 [Coelomomyces lativittatus]|nr:hypothetical protein HMI54_011955 [Coelomomyces lativittatus]